MVSEGLLWELFLLHELSVFIVIFHCNVFTFYVLLTSFYFWAIESHDCQVEINTYWLMGWLAARTH